MPPEACELLTAKVGSKDTEDVCLQTGHIGIYVSSKCQQEFVPKITQWLSVREKQPAKTVVGRRVSTAKLRSTAKVATD